jgi:hypothetical protein
MKIIILGHTVEYEEAARQGVVYLTQKIDSHEARVFFDQALRKGVAHFEDQMGCNYKLSLNGSEYNLIKV